jgi:hypothetical protein
VRFVRVGTLDEHDRLPPDIHIFTSSKQPWLTLPPGAKTVLEFYDVESRRAVVHVWEVDAVGNEAPIPHELRKSARWKPLHDGKIGNRVGVRIQHHVFDEHNRTDLVIGHCREGSRTKLASVTGMGGDPAKGSRKSVPPRAPEIS